MIPLQRSRGIPTHMSFDVRSYWFLLCEITKLKEPQSWKRPKIQSRFFQ